MKAELLSAYGYVEPKLAIYERWCVVHSSPLIDLRCAYKHGEGYVCPRWYLVRDGIVEAECSRDKVRWLRGTPETDRVSLKGRRIAKYRQPKVRQKLDPSVKRERRRKENLRRHERARAAREGREPAEWARLIGPTRKPAALQAPAKRTA